MGEVTKIQWTDHTFNPWIGCTKVSAGCTNCYAEVETFPRVQRGRGLELWGPKAERHVTSASNWRKPIAWNREAYEEAQRTGDFIDTRRRVFCASLGDVFEDRRDLDEARGRLWDLIAQTPYLDWLLLTKRPQHILDLIPPPWRDTLPTNIWTGTTVEDQERADERVRHLARVPAAVRFLSVEPMIGPVRDRSNVAGGWRLADVDWVICGGESGTHARPFDLAWARSLRDEAARAGAAFFMKQLGARPITDSDDDRRHCGDMNLPHPFQLQLRDSKGGDPSEWPEDLRVRQWPERKWRRS